MCKIWYICTITFKSLFLNDLPGPSPSKESASTPVPKKVSLPHISRVISDVYGDKMAAGAGGEDSFPLQQKLVVCSLLLLTQQSKIKEVTLGKVSHAQVSFTCL